MRYKQEIDLRPIKFVVKEIKGFSAAKAYEFDETIHPKGDLQPRGNLGGVIVCPADLQTKPGLFVASSLLKYNRAQIFHRGFWVRLFGKKRDEVVLDYNDFGNDSIFKGHFLNRESGEMYDSHSATLEISGLSSKELLALAKCILDNQRGNDRDKELLVNDLNQHKHYLLRVQEPPQKQIPEVIDGDVVNNISRYFEPFECAIIRKFPKSIESVNNGVFSKIREYAESEEYKKESFVPLMYRRDWDRRLYAVALKLHYTIATSNDCYVFINAGGKPDFFKNVQKLARAFNQKFIIVKEAASQNAFKEHVDVEFSRGFDFEFPAVAIAGEKTDEAALSSQREPVGRFVESIPLTEILRQTSSQLSTPLRFKDNDELKRTMQLCLDSWEGRNNMGKYMISQITKKLMEELGLES